MTQTAAIKRVPSAQGATKYTCRVWQAAYFTARKSMPHEEAVKAADASVQTTQTTANTAYYMGKNDYWNEFKPEPARAGEFSEDYKRGYRHARSEDRLDGDIEWD